MLSNMGEWRRSHTCGELRVDNVGHQVTLMGWVQRRRDHGGVIFVDLRDRYGITQVVINNEISPEGHSVGDAIRSEYVIAVKGEVVLRPEGLENSALLTGKIEIKVAELRVLNTALTPPFALDEFDKTSEEVRLKYRYLDLRRTQLQENIILRNSLTKKIREYLYNNNFLDIETPFLTKSTPEGARDYLVPSRVNDSKFYALPQSPQMFKQLLMMSGFDRYFQIVRCFRDEDLRSDRQPEFTQLDLEMSFIDREDIIKLIEGLFVKLFKELLNVEVQTPFPRMLYSEAMEKFGHDAPDTRFNLHLKTINSLVKGCGFKVFADASELGSVKALNAVGAGHLSRKDIDELTDLVVSLGAKGLAYIKVTENGFQSPIVKFLGEDLAKQIVDTMGAKTGDIVFFGAGETKTVNLTLHKLRLELANRLKLIDNNKYSLTWVLDFPLLEWDEESKRYVAVHHPFTSPMDEDVHLLSTAPADVRAKAYDLVLNGSEIGGGSIRVHRSDVQKSLFELMGFKDEDLQSRFGFFVDALKYGTPPHGGMAFGIDRIAAIFTHSESIRDVIAFPKTQRAIDLMTDAPSFVDEKQLRELHIKLSNAQKK